jgi:hypothetical protein
LVRDEKFGSPRVVTLLLGVLTAIEFNDQSALDAGEVGDVEADRVLASEFVPSELAIAQEVPKLALGVGLTSTQFASLVSPPHPNPLPLRGQRSSLARNVAPPSPQPSTPSGAREQPRA